MKPVTKTPLLQKQHNFAVAAAKLIMWLDEHGFLVTFGEAYRSPEEAKRLAKTGAGITKSLHTKRLAIDLNIFGKARTLNEDMDNKVVFYDKTSDYEDKGIGEFWESLGGSWGGRFKSRPDGNHFSFEHEGVK